MRFWQGNRRDVVRFRPLTPHEEKMGGTLRYIKGPFITPNRAERRQHLRHLKTREARAYRLQVWGCADRHRGQLAA